MHFLVWIYLMVFLFGIINLYFKCNASEIIYINVNLDYLPDNKTQKVYDKELTFNCSYFKNYNGNIFVNLTGNIATSVCNTSNNIEFHLFTYRSTITSATITVINNKKAESHIILMDEKEIVILNYNDKFITYVKCNLPNCYYNGIDQNEIINKQNEEIYSACSDSNCLTQLEFTRDFGKFRFNNSEYFGNVIKMSKLIWPLQPKNVINCRNNGTYNPASNKCDCPKNKDFFETGPECESLQISLTSQQYLYALPNSNGLKIEFALFIPALQGANEILTINRDKKEFLKYVIYETKHTINVSGSILTLDHAVDVDDSWTNVFINIYNNNNQRKIIFQANANLNTTESNGSFDLRFDRIPLILHKIEKVEVCLQNLFVNDQIVDLYLPAYQNCRPNCDHCKANEKCIPRPFKSKAEVKCFCQVGMKKTVNGCESDTNRTLNIKNHDVVSIDIQAKNSFDRIQYKFRTYSQNALLSFVNLSDPNNSAFTIAASNSYLQVNITNATYSLSNTLPYNVSDGEWHTIMFKITNYLMEVILDENMQYNLKIRFVKELFGNKFHQFKIKKITMGPFNQSIHNKYVSCSSIDTFSLISFTDFNFNEYITAESGNMSNICDFYTCAKVNCSVNENCINEWQNPICNCNDNFIKIQGKCIFAKCEPNPCKNDGICRVQSDKKDYQCDCGPYYEGTNCELQITKAEFLWWIILLVIIILLIILIVLLIWCCCRTKQKQEQNAPDINKIHENTVCYNDQAGEADYNGPPINFSLINNASQMKPYKVLTAPLYPNNELRELKMKMDAKNDDLIIDHPLEYGYEGADSEIGSISSFGSKSTDEELDIYPIKSNNEKFNNLNEIYN